MVRPIYNNKKEREDSGGGLATSVTKQDAEASENAPYSWNPLLH